MLRKISYLLIAAGVIFLCYGGYLLFDFYFGSQYKLEEAETFLNEFVVSAEESPEEKEYLMELSEFQVDIGDVYGTIEIPSIDLKLPIVYGAEPEHLKYGVGHIPETWFPNEGDQVFLTGHNDSAFLNIGDLGEGDSIYINVPYGTFEYRMTYGEVGHESEVDRVGSMDEETLVLMTCYPFFTLTLTEERYFLYAERVQ